MNSDSIVILGVPVDNLDMAETLSRLFAMSREYDADGRPRMAATVTAETIMRLRRFSGKGEKDNRKQEAKQTADPSAETGHDDKNNDFLINTLRNADLMIPLGLPVTWAARILGITPKKPISAAGFFRKFLEEASSAEKTAILPEKSGCLYECSFLTKGDSTGMDDPLQKMSDAMTGAALAAGTPASVAAPTVPLEAIHEQINSVGADFLVLDINNPELAQWFEKSKNRIHVPVILLVSGTDGLKNILPQKEIIKAPEAGGKWILFRPFRRLYHNYFEFGFMVLPLVIYQKYNQAVFNLRHKPSMIPSIKTAPPKAAGGTLIKIISMPDPLDASITEDIRAKIREMSQSAPKIVLDFSRVNFMDSSGLGLLMGLCRGSAAENREIFLTGVKPKIYDFLTLTKTIDFFKYRIMDSLPEILESVKKRMSTASFYYLALIRNNAVIFHFYGKLDAAGLMDINPDVLIDQVVGKDVIVNLAEVEFIDSAGIRLLVKLHRQVSRYNGALIACGMQGVVGRLFSILGIDRLFMMEEDQASAELTLRRLHIRRLASPEKTPFSSA